MVREGKRSLAVAAAGVLAALCAGAASGSIPDPAGVIHGCLGAKGDLRVVDTEAGEACKKKESELTWAQRGYATDPDGNRVYDNPTGEHIFTTTVHAPSLDVQDRSFPGTKIWTGLVPGNWVFTSDGLGGAAFVDPLALLGIGRDSAGNVTIGGELKGGALEFDRASVGELSVSGRVKLPPRSTPANALDWGLAHANQVWTTDGAGNAGWADLQRVDTGFITDAAGDFRFDHPLRATTFETRSLHADTGDFTAGSAAAGIVARPGVVSLHAGVDGAIRLTAPTIDLDGALNVPAGSFGLTTLAVPAGSAGKLLTGTDAGAVALTDPIADLGLAQDAAGNVTWQRPSLDLNGACRLLPDSGECAKPMTFASVKTPQCDLGATTTCAAATLTVGTVATCAFAADGTTCSARLTAPEIRTPGCTFGAANNCADLSLGRATIGGCTLATGAASCTGTIAGGTLKSAGCTLGSAASGTACTGPFFINGTLQVTGGKLFTIDHPLDPKQKLLSHAAVESPALTNLYNGNAVTDGRGFATVRLPGYFQALNREFRYQLTVVGRTFAQAIVWREIEKNRFTIKTDGPHVKVSWQVTGVRHDRYALQHPLRVEQTKPPALQGRTFYR